MQWMLLAGVSRGYQKILLMAGMFLLSLGLLVAGMFLLSLGLKLPESRGSAEPGDLQSACGVTLSKRKAAVRRSSGGFGGIYCRCEEAAASSRRRKERPHDMAW